MTEEGERDGIEQRLVTGDASTLRALAHPLRVEILRVLDDLHEATATQIAEHVGESPSNCSFHLRQLAKAGFIERAEAKGTQRPWRPVHRGRDLRPDPTDPESVRASGAIGAAYVQQEAARVVDYLTVRRDDDPEWILAMTVNTSSFWATAEETRALNDELHHLVDRFAGRGDHPERRPEGARLVRLLATVNVDPDSEPTPAAESAASSTADEVRPESSLTDERAERS